MTIAEKIEMYKGKKAFVKSISKVFQDNPNNHTVESVDYEVYQKEIARDENIYRNIVEFIIVRFKGGSISTRRVTGNSNTANFRVVGFLIDGGYYDEVSDYEDLVESGDYDFIVLEDS